MTNGTYDRRSPEVYRAVTLDRLGHRYGLLPSEVLSRASTLDLHILDVALSYEMSEEQRRSGALPEMATEDLQAILKLKRKS